jgi:hypothetical protein
MVGSPFDRFVVGSADLGRVISRLITDAGSAGEQGVHLANRLHKNLCCAHAHSQPAIPDPASLRA